MAAPKLTRFTPKKRGKFLSVLADTANVSAAAKAVGISRQAIYKTRSNDAEFAAEWDDVIETVIDNMESEVFRRAVKGTDKPIYYQGEQVTTVKEYSDALLMHLLKAHRPEKYRAKYHEAPPLPDGGEQGGVQFIDVAEVPWAIDDINEWQRLVDEQKKN